MNQRLNQKQYVPLADDELEALHKQAEAHGISNGLLARSLVLHGLDGIGDPDVVARIEKEKEDAARRLSEGARAAVKARWGASGKD